MVQYAKYPRIIVTDTSVHCDLYAMPGHAGSPYWAAVDFDSEGEEAQRSPSNHRVYLDPWDTDAYGMMQADTTESSQGDNYNNSFAGEPVSASFYYVPTKNYDSGEEPPLPPPRWKKAPPEEIIAPPESIYGRRLSRKMAPDYPPEAALYGERPMTDRRRSMYVEDPAYMPHPMLYEPVYGMVPPGYMPPPPRSRTSMTHHPDYVTASLGYPNHRRPSRMTEAYEQMAYESLSPEYEDWARPFPKAAPDNFHLSRYGHLQIDYSCSWNTLDRLIRSQHRG